MFEALSERLQEVFRRLRGRGRLGEAEVQEAMREVRLALLEADVNFKVVKDFVARVRERAVGSEVLESLTPGQTVVKIVHEELIALLGGAASGLSVSPRPPTVVLLAGLQGSGKTTTTAKLALVLRRGGKRPLMVAADLQRPAAVEQLAALARQLELAVFLPRPGDTPLTAARAGLREADRLGSDTVLVDTAGRLQVDEALMEELAELRRELRPHEVLLVVDAMTGQEAVAVAETFDRRLGIDGIVLTKLDGDARGGAALSVRAVTGKPIKFVGTGEKADALEVFHPDRLASRILGMGDMLTLIERAQAGVDLRQAREMERKLRKNQLNLQDFLDQLRQMRRMGPLDQFVSMLPGAAKLKGLQVDEGQLTRMEAIINSMTPRERSEPGIIDGSRRKRIAAGSGTKVQDVNRLLRQFDQTRKLLRNMSEPGRRGRFPFPLP
ncbi:MAG: signal recognition particle protein [Thermaerobacter sp.]|nr:signal recognition particle protein [Thermaerobacter sp.]